MVTLINSIMQLTFLLFSFSFDKHRSKALRKEINYCHFHLPNVLLSYKSFVLMFKQLDLQKFFEGSWDGSNNFMTKILLLLLYWDLGSMTHSQFYIRVCNYIINTLL